MPILSAATTSTSAGVPGGCASKKMFAFAGLRITVTSVGKTLEMLRLTLSSSPALRMRLVGAKESEGGAPNRACSSQRFPSVPSTSTV
jgi:hypothetical protein